MHNPPSLCHAHRPCQWHRGATGRHPGIPPAPAIIFQLVSAAAWVSRGEDAGGACASIRDRGAAQLTKCVPSGRPWWTRTGPCALCPSGGSADARLYIIFLFIYLLTQPRRLARARARAHAWATYACPSRTWRLERKTAGCAACVRLTPACSHPACAADAQLSGPAAARGPRPAPLAPRLASRARLASESHE
jgi:hypothetical protein